MPGMGEEMEGAMQQAPQCSRQSMNSTLQQQEKAATLTQSGRRIDGAAC